VSCKSSAESGHKCKSSAEIHVSYKLGLISFTITNFQNANTIFKSL